MMERFSPARLALRFRPTGGKRLNPAYARLVDSGVVLPIAWNGLTGPAHHSALPVRQMCVNAGIGLASGCGLRRSSKPSRESGASDESIAHAGGAGGYAADREVLRGLCAEGLERPPQ
jgi:hypothetical protein